MWDELTRGSLGAVVLADTRRLEACFAAVDFFERRGIGFLIAINDFDGAYKYDPGELRAALKLSPHVPIMNCDARDRRSATKVLIGLIQHLLAGASSSESRSPQTPMPTWSPS
jgi:hypothetical protein